MLGSWFYHQRVRKSVAVFGSLFNDIYVLRKNSSGEVINQVKVPLSYAPKRDFIDRIAQMNNGEDAERQLAIKLPRMSFEILTIAYDPLRALPKVNNRIRSLTGSSSNDTKVKLYNGVPYTLTFQLNVYSKSQDDALQIVEQIIPYFNPQYNLTVKPIDDLPDVKEDNPIILQSVSFTDDYEGALESRRTIIYTLDFEMKVNFYGPTATAPIVREVDVDIYDMDKGLADSDVFIETIQTTPNPLNVSPDSDYTLTTTIINALGDSI